MSFAPIKVSLSLSEQQLKGENGIEGLDLKILKLHFFGTDVKTPHCLIIFLRTPGFYNIECKHRSNSTSELIAKLNRAPRFWNVNKPNHQRSTEAENVKRAYDSNPIIAINESWQNCEYK